EIKSTWSIAVIIAEYDMRTFHLWIVNPYVRTRRSRVVLSLGVASTWDSVGGDNLLCGYEAAFLNSQPESKTCNERTP
ncbi:MAG: hypothetical protein WAS23_10760, partial [Dokdonella sp.]|uniref:hypothetical protein n=1 Tax=Dokdonella sp. TaxID=2291710 RepID=UPI003BAE7E15